MKTFAIIAALVVAVTGVAMPEPKKNPKNKGDKGNDDDQGEGAAAAEEGSVTIAAELAGRFRDEIVEPLQAALDSGPPEGADPVTVSIAQFAILEEIYGLVGGEVGDVGTGDADTGDADTGDADTGDGDTGNGDTGDGDTGNGDTGDGDTGNGGVEKRDAAPMEDDDTTKQQQGGEGTTPPDEEAAQAIQLTAEQAEAAKTAIEAIINAFGVTFPVDEDQPLPEDEEQLEAIKTAFTELVTAILGEEAAAADPNTPAEDPNAQDPNAQGE